MDIFPKDKSRVAFLTKRSIIKDLQCPTNIILSPEYYWVKKVHLPISKLYQAKKYAPAVFEEHLPSGTEYDYVILNAKEKNEFIVIAYSKSIILNALKKQVNDISKIKGIYWSQIELSALKTCIAIDAHGSLSKIDEMVLYLPQPCEESKESLYDIISKTSLSQNYLKLNSLTYEQIPKTSAYKLIASALLFIGAFGVDYAVHQYKINQNEQKIASIKEEYNMPKTSMEFKNIQSRLSKIDKKQKDFRALLKIIEDILLKRGTTLKSLSFDKKAFQVTIMLESKKDKKIVQNYLSKNAILANEQLNGLKYTVELANG